MIEYNGKKVALGIPGTQRHSNAEAYSNVPLRKAGTPDDAAGAVLLYEFLAFMGVRVTDDLLQFGFTARLLCVRTHIGSDRGCRNIMTRCTISHMLLCNVFFQRERDTRSRAVKDGLGQKYLSLILHRRCKGRAAP